ncbi:MAG: RDD family protein [bacterium]|jgi:uncharacterized RDD family membrane protein YckC
MQIGSGNNSLRFAGLWTRFTALLIDFTLLSLPFFVITRIVKGVWLMGAKDHRWATGWFISDPLCIIFLTVIVLYFILLEGLAGMTVGKRLLGIKVVDVEGGRPGLKKSLVRNLLRAVDSLPALNVVGVILILKSPERARFGDRIAGTRVVKLMK